METFLRLYEVFIVDIQYFDYGVTNNQLWRNLVLLK